ncbi:hypothetical protein [Sinomicrobium sp. M5D2P9]
MFQDLLLVCRIIPAGSPKSALPLCAWSFISAGLKKPMTLTSKRFLLKASTWCRAVSSLFPVKKQFCFQAVALLTNTGRSGAKSAIAQLF